MYSAYFIEDYALQKEVESITCLPMTFYLLDSRKILSFIKLLFRQLSLILGHENCSYLFEVVEWLHQVFCLNCIVSFLRLSEVKLPNTFSLQQYFLL